MVEIVREIAYAKSPILREVRREEVDAIGISRHTLDSGEIVDAAPLTATSEMLEPILDAAAADKASLVSMLDKASNELAQQLVDFVIGNLSRVLEAAGQVTDAKGEINADMLIDTLDSIQLSFEPDGTWRPPSIFAGTAAAEKIARLPPLTTEQRQRVQAIVQRQQEAFLATRRSRRIPRNPI